LFGVLIVLCSGQPLMAASPDGDVAGKVVVGYHGWYFGLKDARPTATDRTIATLEFHQQSVG
jgi:hypothetical protein